MSWFGQLRTFSPELIVPDPSLPVYAAIAPWSDKDNTYYFSLLYSVGQAMGVEIQTPWNQLTAEQQEVILHGTKEPIIWRWTHSIARKRAITNAMRA